MAIRTLWMDSDGAGAVEYFARDFRDLTDVLFEPGVFDGLEVVERSAGANMTVTITAPGRCVIESTYTSDMGSYLVTVPTDEEDITIGAAPGSGTRRDIVGLQVQDHSAGGPTDIRECVPLVVEGDTSGDDPVLPDSFIALARVRVPSGTASITNALIDDLREPARLKYEVASTDVLADGSVTTAKLADEAVTTAKLDDDAVTSAKIDDGTIVNGNISTSAPSWVTATPATGWTNSSGGLRVTRWGSMVVVCGSLERTGSTTNNSTMTTLAASYRPGSAVRVGVVSELAGDRAFINTNGTIVVNQATEGATYAITAVFPAA